MKEKKGEKKGRKIKGKRIGEEEE
jgi:hypothetical protein